MRGISTRRLVPGAAITLAGLTVYAPTLNNPLVCDDYYLLGIDRLHMFGYEHLGNLSTLQWIFYAEWPVQLRPIPLAGFRFLSYFFSLTAWPFHLFGVLLHIGCALLLFALIASLGINRLAAAMAGLLFVLTPVAPETVTWPAGIVDTYPLFFMLAVLYFYVRFLKCGSRLAYAGAIAAMGAALLSKEVAIPMIALIPAADLLLAGPLGAGAAPDATAAAPSRLTGFYASRLKRLIPFLILFGLYLLMRYLILGVIVGSNAQVLSSAGRELSFAGLQATLFKLMSPLNAFHSELWVRWLFFGFQSLLLLSALLAITIRQARVATITNRVMLLFLMMFLAPIVPVAGTLMTGIKDDLQWSHFLYVPMAAFLAMLSIALCEYSWSRRLRLYVALPALGLLAVFSAWGLVQNNQMWEVVSYTEGRILEQVVSLVPDPAPGATIYLAAETAGEGERLYWCIPMQQPAIRATYARYDLQVKQLSLDQIGSTSDGYLLIVDGSRKVVRLEHEPAAARPAVSP